MMKGLRQMAAALGDLFMPRKCIVCGRALGVEERHLCLYCTADLPLTYFWDRTHNPMADRLNACLQDREGMPYAYAAALFFYDGDVPYKMIPRALKYEYGIREGRYFAAMLGRYLAASEAFADVDCIMPVPLHWLRRLKRGYNQAAVIARAVAKEMGVPCRENVLVRARRTSTQTRLGGEDRARNVAGAFRVGPSVISTKAEGRVEKSPSHILLLDDVFTTGSTTAECFRALAEAFPGARISVATLAFVE